MRLNCGDENGVSLVERTSQGIARIARTVGGLAISRAFLRAVLSRGADRHDKYRPRIDGLEVSCFAGLSCR
jgi:hypothetical protein